MTTIELLTALDSGREIRSVILGRIRKKDKLLVYAVDDAAVSSNVYRHLFANPESFSIVELEPLSPPDVWGKWEVEVREEGGGQFYVAAKCSCGDGDFATFAGPYAPTHDEAVALWNQIWEGR